MISSSQPDGRTAVGSWLRDSLTAVINGEMPSAPPAVMPSLAPPDRLAANALKQALNEAANGEWDNMGQFCAEARAHADAAIWGDAALMARCLELAPAIGEASRLLPS